MIAQSEQMQGPNTQPKVAYTAPENLKIQVGTPLLALCPFQERGGK